MGDARTLGSATAHGRLVSRIQANLYAGPELARGVQLFHKGFVGNVMYPLMTVVRSEG